jgi:hypothetical protein
MVRGTQLEEEQGYHYDNTSTSGPVDPDQMDYLRQRRPTADEIRFAKPHEIISAAPPAEVLTEAIQACYHRQEAFTIHLLEMMEKKQLLVLEEFHSRQNLQHEEAADWQKGIASHSEACLSSVFVRERHSLALLEVGHRRSLAASYHETWMSMLDTFLSELQVAVAAEEARRLAEEAVMRRGSEEPPPPPTTPKPVQQFVDDDGDGDDAAMDQKRAVLQQLKSVVRQLPPSQRKVVEGRIAALEDRLNASNSARTADRSSPIVSQKPPNPYTPLSAMTPRLSKSSTPIAYGADVTPKRHHVTHRTPPAHRTVATRTPLKMSPTSPAGRGVLQSQHPIRSDVVEFLRSILQPIYNEGKLPRDVFLEVVRHITHKFFGCDWAQEATQRFGLRDTGGSSLTEVPLWKQYLHAELCDVLGDELLL